MTIERISTTNVTMRAGNITISFTIGGDSIAIATPIASIGMHAKDIDDLIALLYQSRVELADGGNPAV